MAVGLVIFGGGTNAAARSIARRRVGHADGSVVVLWGSGEPHFLLVVSYSSTIGGGSDHLCCLGGAWRVLVLTGVVTSLSADGFGFVAPDRGGGEFWMRPQNGGGQGLELVEGDAVAFDLSFGELGPEAVDIRRVAD